MIRLYLVVEGRTEERFAQRLLREHLSERGIALSAMVVPLGGGGRGGGSRWIRWEHALSRLLKEQRGQDVRATTLLDLYAIPLDTPGWTPPKSARGSQRADAMLLGMTEAFGDRRFIPYVQVHEFEALIFSRLEMLDSVAEALGAQSALRKLGDSSRGLAPEEIDDGPQTAPSKRILSAVPGFRKTVDGVDALVRIGLPTIRAACPRFNAWVTKLESLGTTQS